MIGSFPAPDDKDDRPPRRYSIWTLLAPAALLVVVIAMFNALGSSCVLKGCDGKDGKSTGSDATATAGKSAKPGDAGRMFYRVRSGDTGQSIADRFGLTLEELQTCNPKVADFYTLQPGQRLTVSTAKCKTAENDSL